MKTDWQEELSSRKLPEFEKLNETDWVQRRNEEVLDPKENETEVTYKYESRFLSDDVKQQVDIIQDIVSNTTDADQYKDGYEAALILLGGES